MMKIFSTIILFHFFLSLFCQSDDKNSLETHGCDSLIIQELRTHMDEIMADSFKFRIDSSVWDMIGDHRVYKMRFSRSSIGEHSFLLLMNPDDLKCSFKSYAYIFDYFFELDLDFDYDYYSLSNKKTGLYYTRERDKEYQASLKLMQFFFKTYGRFEVLTLNLEEEDRQNMIRSLIDFGDLRYPLQTEQILNGKPQLDRELYEEKLFEAMNKE